jgi:hypothetical protein
MSGSGSARIGMDRREFVEAVLTGLDDRGWTATRAWAPLDHPPRRGVGVRTLLDVAGPGPPRALGKDVAVVLALDARARVGRGGEDNRRRFGGEPAAHFGEGEHGQLQPVPPRPVGLLAAPADHRTDHLVVGWFDAHQRAVSVRQAFTIAHCSILVRCRVVQPPRLSVLTCSAVGLTALSWADQFRGDAMG